MEARSLAGDKYFVRCEIRDSHLSELLFLPSHGRERERERDFVRAERSANGNASEVGGRRKIARVGEEVNIFTIRLGIFVSGNLLAKLGKLAATVAPFTHRHIFHSRHSPS